MATNMFMVLLIILIHDEFSCNTISAQYNTISDYNGFHNNPDISSIEDHGYIPTSDIFATTPDFIRKYGYPVETHTVTTEDGYVLTVHRIPGSPKAASSGVKTPVLLAHGIFATSESYVLLGPDKGLGFLLADQGYDVWLGNSRGNVYSRKHVTLSPEEPKFWNFSWHEMGVYDLPATIDHILMTTSQTQLFYVGHSMGSTTFFVLTSTRPEYNVKIRLGVNMAPAVYVNPLRARLLKLAARYTDLIYRIATATGLHEVSPRVMGLQILLGQVCREGSPLLEVCFFGFSLAFGFNRPVFDTANADIIFSHLLAGSSLNAAIHFAEILATDRFQQFDPTVTLGKFTPEYNLSQVSAPVYILYAENDILVHPKGVMKLKRSLPNVVRLHRLPDDLAGHTDFVFAKNGKQLFYDEMISEMNRYK